MLSTTTEYKDRRVEDERIFKENIAFIKNKFNLSDSQISKLIYKGYTISEMMEGSIDKKTKIYTPKDILMSNTRKYLLSQNILDNICV